MTDTSNSTSRLYALLKEAKRMGNDKQIKEVWAFIGNLDPSDHPSILRFLADLIILAAEAKNAIENLEDVNHDIYLMPFKNIEKALSRINLEAKWETFSRFLDEPTMVALSFCADTLSRASSDHQIPEEELKKLKAEIDALLEKVVELDIPEELKTFLTEQLEKMRAAVLSYRIHGNQGFKRVLESIFGATILHQDSIRAEMAKENNKAFLVKFWKVVENFANAATIIEAAKALSGPVTMLLTSGK